MDNPSGNRVAAKRLGVEIQVTGDFGSPPLLCEREVEMKIGGVWGNPYSTLVVTQTIHTGCSKCFGTGSVYVQVSRGNGGWTQMWMICDLCRGKGHA